MVYCAIIGDIVNSKKIPNRQEIQDLFYSVLMEINMEFCNDIASDFTVTLGDEFQGLISKPSLSYEIIIKIKQKMSPIELVFGVGIGEMHTTIRRDISIGSDGPAYHYARNMVEKAKKKRPSIRYYSDTTGDELINGLLYFTESCINSRTAKQVEAVKLYDELKSQKEVAMRLNKTQAAISGILVNAFYYEVANSEEEIRLFLKTKFEN